MAGEAVQLPPSRVRLPSAPPDYALIVVSSDAPAAVSRAAHTSRPLCERSRTPSVSGASAAASTAGSGCGCPSTATRGRCLRASPRTTLARCSTAWAACSSTEWSRRMGGRPLAGSQPPHQRPPIRELSAQRLRGVQRHAAACCGVLRRAAACSGVQRRAAACCGVLRRAAACSGVQRRAGACCGVLRRSAPPR